MPANPLPYDMGNAGDLLKHGVLSEFTGWWCERNEGPFRFADPFGGRPWVAPPVSVVSERLERLRTLGGLALCNAQPDCREKYYGSGYVVRNLTSAMGHEARIHVSDREPAARRALLASGLEELQAEGFDPADGYSALRAELNADLLLIDPFEEFLRNHAASVLPLIARVSSSMAVLLFVMVPGGDAGRLYARLKARYLPNAWTLGCSSLEATGVRGESRYDMEALLAADTCLSGPDGEELGRRVERLRRCLSQVLTARVVFQRQ